MSTSPLPIFVKIYQEVLGGGSYVQFNGMILGKILIKHLFRFTVTRGNANCIWNAVLT